MKKVLLMLVLCLIVAIPIAGTVAHASHSTMLQECKFLV